MMSAWVLTVPSYRAANPLEEDVPILTVVGMVALIGMLCIAGAGRITKKRWEVMSRHYELCEHDHNIEFLVVRTERAWRCQNKTWKKPYER
jgi:hypothetical protein